MSESPVVLSASSVNTYLRCGLQWYFAYVLNVKAPPSLRQTIGIAGHEAVELNMRQKITTRHDLPVTDLTDAFSSAFDAIAPDVELGEDEHLGRGKDSGVAAVKVYRKIAAPLIQPIEVEKSVQFGINGIPFSGQIDVVDDDGAIRDTKFVGRSPSKDQYRLNMTGYALAYRQLASTPGDPAIESDTILDVVVRTTRPKYVAVRAGGPLSEGDIRSFARIVTSVHEGIQKGNFPMNGLVSGACNWCGFKPRCPAWTK